VSNNNFVYGVTSLGSGSRGNATIIKSDKTAILVDNGFSCKELEARLEAKGLSPSEISFVLITHEHSDHASGVARFCRKYQVPVWLNMGTSLALNLDPSLEVHIFDSHTDFYLNDIQVIPVAVPHDSREPCQFIFIKNDKKTGLLTDLGHITPYVKEMFTDCCCLLLEFNHDREMLYSGKYPPQLKQRVGGDYGHLNNMQACEFLQYFNFKSLKHLVAMHLSLENNCSDIVKAMLVEQLPNDVEFHIADQQSGFDWIDIK